MAYNATHRLASINGPSGFRGYTHDVRGNVTGRPGYTHSFDAVNRLVQSQPVGGNVEFYEYDGHGRRTVTARSNGSVKIDYYTRDGVLRASADTGMGSTGGSAVYVHLGDVPVAQDRMEVSYLPSNSPDLNPDEYLNRDFKTKLPQGPSPETAKELSERARLAIKATAGVPEHVRSYLNHPI